MKATIDKALLEQVHRALQTEQEIYCENDPEDGAPEYLNEAVRYLQAALAEPAAEPMPSEQITDHIRSIDIDLREDLCSFSFRSGVRWAEKQHGIGGG